MSQVLKNLYLESEIIALMGDININMLNATFGGPTQFNNLSNMLSLR